jgi:hypothetical protein
MSIVFSEANIENSKLTYENQSKGLYVSFAGKTYTTLVWEDEDVGQRFKGCVVADGRQEEREEASVGNEMFGIVQVLAEARR